MDDYLRNRQLDWQRDGNEWLNGNNGWLDNGSNGLS